MRRLNGPRLRAVGRLPALVARRGMIFELLSCTRAARPGCARSRGRRTPERRSSEPSGMMPPTRSVPLVLRLTRAGAAKAASGPNAMRVVSIAPIPRTLPRSMNSRRLSRPSLNSSIRWFSSSPALRRYSRRALSDSASDLHSAMERSRHMDDLGIGVGAAFSTGNPRAHRPKPRDQSTDWRTREINEPK